MKYKNKAKFDCLPIGTNHAYAQRNGRRYLTEEAKEWKKEIALSFPKNPNYESGEYVVKIFVKMGDKRKRDIDSGLKFILDALSDVVWKDDRQVVEVHLYKSYGKKHETEICVSELN